MEFFHPEEIPLTDSHRFLWIFEEFVVILPNKLLLIALGEA